MKKIVKVYGHSLVIVFNNEDKEVYNIKKGDILDLSDAFKVKYKKVKKD
jgi:hypothetical protein|tara:strand:- start:5208 stop:5354 length:147 start_codon:yes stop_codon:yes gene_type:complete